MASKKPREGSLLRFSLGTGVDAFARVLANSQVAIYSLQWPHGIDVPWSTVYESKVLWKLTVMKSALISGRWSVVDHRPLEPELTTPVEYFIRDHITGKYSLYRSSDGHTMASSFDECKALEAAAVWDAEHVEDRVRDYFSRRPNAWAEQLKAVP